MVSISVTTCSPFAAYLNAAPAPGQNSGETFGGSAAKTGDDSKLELMITLALISIGAIAQVFVYRRKRAH